MMKNLASTLTDLMRHKGIKSAELARRTGVGQPVIHRLMTGVTENPQILTLKPIADFFNVTIEQLLGISSVTSQPKKHDKTFIHDMNNKLGTVKTISGVLLDLLPMLIEGYQKAVSINLLKETIPDGILPLLLLNVENLMKTTEQIKELVINNNQ